MKITSIVVALCCLLLSALSLAAKSSNPIAGNWEGIYLDSGFPLEIQLKLSLQENPQQNTLSEARRAAGRSDARRPTARQLGESLGAGRAGATSIEGEFTYKTIRWDNVPRGYNIDKFTGVVRYTGTYYPGTATFILHPTVISSTGLAAWEFTAIRGKISKNPLAISATTLTRSESAPTLLLSKSGEAAQWIKLFSAECKQTANYGARPGGPGLDKLYEWLKPLTPDVIQNPRAPGGGQFAYNYPALFSDRYFSSFFGKPFDQLSRKVRDSIFQQINRVPYDRNRPQYELLRRSGNYFLTGGAAEITLKTVLADRIERRWYTEQIDAIRSQSPTMDPPQANPSFAEVYQEFEATLWPEEKQSLAAVDYVKNQAAIKMLPLEIERLAGLRPLALGLNALDERRRYLAELYRVAPREVVNASETKAAARYDEMCAQWIADGPNLIRSLGTGLAAVEGGVSYYRLLQKVCREPKYEANLVPYQNLLAARRSTDFAAAESQMYERMKSWKTYTDATAGVYGWVAIASDREIPAVKRMIEFIPTQNLRNDVNPQNDGHATLIAMTLFVVHNASKDPDAPWGRNPVSGTAMLAPLGETYESKREQDLKESQGMGEVMLAAIAYDTQKRREALDTLIKESLPRE